MTPEDLAKGVALLETTERAAALLVGAARELLAAAHGAENLPVIEAQWRANLERAQKNAGGGA